MDRIDHVLVVDDDRGIRELIAEYLEKNGMRVSVAANGREMRAVLEDGPPDIIVLDLMLPGDDGLVLCRELRASRHRTVPVLMLTARNEETDHIVGLEMGADDYLPKPFAVRELLARIKAVLRRARMLPPGMQVTESAHVLAFGDWRLDTVARHLVDADGTVVALSGALGPGETGAAPDVRLSARMAHAIEAGVGRMYPVTVNTIPDTHEHFQVHLKLSDGAPLTIDVLPMSSIPISPWLPLTLALQLAVTVACSWMAVRLATRPLQQLAKAADALGPDLKSERLPEQGPSEVARAARAFNSMQERIAGYMAERIQSHRRDGARASDRPATRGDAQCHAYAPES